MSWQNSPCVIALRETRRLASRVFGPVDFSALRRFASSLRREIASDLTMMGLLLRCVARAYGPCFCFARKSRARRPCYKARRCERRAILGAGAMADQP